MVMLLAVWVINAAVRGRRADFAVARPGTQTT